MSARTALLALAAGQRPAGALLPPVRLHAGGAELFGEEAAVHAFRRAPIVFSDAAEVLEADGHVAIFEGENALFASTYGDLIARIDLGTPADNPFPRDIALTPDNTRAYVTLRGSGRVAVVDTV
ncbi:MAG: hypothetical protein IBJ13_15460, partial [Sphingopyxis sp.]|nr:hypothetical protein [Sphingopyxis sp.]